MTSSFRKIAVSAAAFSMYLLVALRVTGQPIDTAMAIPIGGIQQWITMKGADRSAPVILFLHGGPGNSVISYSDKFTGELQKKFVVVNWDQRESGRTATLNSSEQKLTVALMTGDAVAVVRYLREFFSIPKIYLMGHSWGGFLGMKVAVQCPQWLAAYIPICPMISQRESERIALDWMMQKATAEKNQKAREELSGITIPFATGEQLYYHRRWLLHYTAGKELSKDMVVSWSDKWLTLFNEASSENFLVTIPRLECPVYFFVGGKDYQTSTKLTTAFYQRVQAPDKQIFEFKAAAHNLPTSEPARLQETIIDSILPRIAK